MEDKSQCKSALEVWKDMRLEVYQQASGNRHEPNCSDDTTKMFSLNDIDEIFEKVCEHNHNVNMEPKISRWSEEDEKKFSDILAILRGGENCHYNSTILTDWFKTLRFQKQQAPFNLFQWKPSEEQIKALEQFVKALCESGYISPYGTRTKLIYSLLAQLKQL